MQRRLYIRIFCIYTSIQQFDYIPLHAIYLHTKQLHPTIEATRDGSFIFLFLENKISYRDRTTGTINSFVTKCDIPLCEKVPFVIFLSHK